MQYFKGYYYKCCSKNDSIAFIPAYHCYNGKRSASLQIITSEGSYNADFPEILFTETEPGAIIGKNIFTSKGIRLELHGGSVDIEGDLRFGCIRPVAYDIMGPFKYVPFMQCRHSVFSMRHKVNGTIKLNGRTLIFKNGTGYIEGDRGSSFPKKYLWSQCFFENGSVMLSAADIPLAGLCFNGTIAVVMIGKTQYRLATYLGARCVYDNKGGAEIIQGRHRLSVKLISTDGKPLKAPDNGKMIRTIHESLKCTASYKFEENKKILLDFVSDKASFEYEL